MKLIFDNKEQKRMFFEDLMGCPGRFGYKEVTNCNFKDSNDICSECWENCGIEIEVLDDSHKML